MMCIPPFKSLKIGVSIVLEKEVNRIDGLLLTLTAFSIINVFANLVTSFKIS